MKFLSLMLCVCIVGAPAWAGEVVPRLDVDGVTYYDVRWGPLQQSKVVIFHSRGIATLPADKLPEEYQTLVGYKPGEQLPPTRFPEPDPKPLVEGQPSSPVTITHKVNPNELLAAMRVKRDPPQVNTEWAAYNRDRLSKVLLDGKLVDKSSLRELIGFIRQSRVQVEYEGRTVNGSLMELAERRPNTRSVAQQMELRPSLWQGTGVKVVLRNYSQPVTESTALARIYAIEDEPISDQPVYRVGKEPTFEQWQVIGRR